MAQVEEHYGYVDCIAVKDLHAGQIGKVVHNGGTNHDGHYVVGMQRILQIETNLHGAVVYAANLTTGVPVSNENTMVRPYPLDTILQIRSRR